MCFYKMHLGIAIVKLEMVCYVHETLFKFTVKSLYNKALGKDGSVVK